ncbi:MAG: sulfatase [Fuerstiella sp.]
MKPFCLISLLVLSFSTVEADDRPNIVFAFADDWGRYASAYGELESGGLNDLVKTPNFDAMAKQGVLFTNAFVNAPSCTPCRSSLLSGQHFWRTGQGAILQGAVWDKSIPSYPLLLQKAGYHIGYTYKVWSPGTPVNAPYGEAANRYSSNGSRFNGFSQYVSRAADGVADGATDGDLSVVIDAAKQELLSEVRGNFDAFLADRNQDQPFCYWFGPTNCHRKWTRGSGKRLWNLDPDQLKGKVPRFLPDVSEVREDLADYLGEAMAFDAALGVLLEQLEASGQADNTIVVVSGDHGAPGFPNGKCNLYDFGTQVALAIRWPKKAPANRIVSDFVSLPDLAATFLEAANEPIPEVMTARSLLPILLSNRDGQIDPTRDHVLVGRERHVAAVRDNWLPYPQRAIRTNKFLYIRNFKPDRWPMGTGPGFGKAEGPMPSATELTENTFAAFGEVDGSPTKSWVALNCLNDAERRKYFDIAFGKRPAEELYELETDPDMTHNIIDQHLFASVRTELSRQLMKELKETGDPRVLGDGSTFDRAPYASEWKKNRKK